jgi:hypothetical protein
MPKLTGSVDAKTSALLGRSGWAERNCTCITYFRAGAYSGEHD